MPGHTRGALYNVGHHIYGPVKLANIRDGMMHTLLVGEHATVSRPRRRTFWAYGWAGYNKSEVTLESRILLGDYDRCVSIPGSPRGCKRMWGSMHSASINFAFCDGSVRTVALDVPVSVLAEMATIEGGEVVRQ